MKRVVFVSLLLFCFSNVGSTHGPFPARPPQSNCFIFYSTGRTDMIGLRNKCEVCKVAVINTINKGKSVVEKHKVGAKSQIEIKAAEVRQILDDESCPS